MYVEQLDKRLTTLKKYVVKISDELMLGSSAKALKYLKAFVDKEF